MQCSVGIYHAVKRGTVQCREVQCSTGMFSAGKHSAVKYVAGDESTTGLLNFLLIGPCSSSFPVQCTKMCWSEMQCHYTLHTAHCTLYTAHWTLNTEHYILHTEHWTLHPKHCIQNCEVWPIVSRKNYDIAELLLLGTKEESIKILLVRLKLIQRVIKHVEQPKVQTNHHKDLELDENWPWWEAEEKLKSPISQFLLIHLNLVRHFYGTCLHIYISTYQLIWSD